MNESPTEKLIRELREENERLLNALKAGGGGIPENNTQQQQQQQQTGISEEGKNFYFHPTQNNLPRESFSFITIILRLITRNTVA